MFFGTSGVKVRGIVKPEKTSGFRVLNVGFWVLVVFQFSGSGCVRVAKKSGYSPAGRSLEGILVS